MSKNPAKTTMTTAKATTGVKTGPGTTATGKGPDPKHLPR